MAIYYYKKIFTYIASFKIKYSYTCAYCGKENEKKQLESCSNSYEQRVQASYRSKFAPEIKMPEEKAFFYQELVTAEAQGKLDRCRKLAKAGNFSFLSKTECALCKKPQPWAFSALRAVSYILLGILIIPSSVTLEYWFFTSRTMVQDLGFFFAWMIRLVWLIVPFVGLVFILLGRDELKMRKAAKAGLGSIKPPTVILPDKVS